MPEYLHLPPLASAIVTITGVVLAVVRLLTASKAFWWRFPEWLQKGLPAALVALGTLPKALEMAQSWLDVAVAFVFAVGAWFTASRGDQRPVEPPKSKAPPSDPGTTISLMPEPVELVAQDRSRLHNDAPDEPAECSGKWRAPDWRLQMVFGTLLACVLACDPRNPPCDEAQLRAVDKAYLDDVTKTCLSKYDTKEDCPAWPALRDKHRADLRKVCPQ